MPGPTRLLLLAVCTALLGPALCSTAAERTAVVEKLLDSGPLNLPVRPDGVGGNPHVTVNISYALRSISDLDTHSGSLDTVGYLSLSWVDPRLAFDASNVQSIRMKSSRIWTPDIELFNSDTVGWRNLNRKDLAIVYQDGRVLWVPHVAVPSMCEQSNPGTGEFTCKMKFGSWTYPGTELDLQLSHPTVDVNDYGKDHRWRLISTSARRNVKYYSCCPESYVDVVFSLKVERQELIRSGGKVVPGGI